MNIKAYLQTKPSTTSEAVGHHRPTTFRQTSSISLKLLLENSIKAISLSPFATPPRNSPFLPKLRTHLSNVQVSLAAQYRTFLWSSLFLCCWTATALCRDRDFSTKSLTAGPRRLSSESTRMLSRFLRRTLSTDTERTHAASAGVWYIPKLQLQFGPQCRKYFYLVIRWRGAQLAPDTTAAVHCQPPSTWTSLQRGPSSGGILGSSRDKIYPPACGSLLLWQTQHVESEWHVRTDEKEQRRAHLNGKSLRWLMCN